MNNEIQAQHLHKDAQAVQTSSANLPTQKQQVSISTIFEMMTALWGNRWCGHFSDPRIGATAAKLWQDSLSDIPPATLVATIKKMAKTAKYAPSIAEIREVALNIISADAAFAEACAWRHNKELRCSNQAVIKAAESIVSWDWANLPPKEIRDAYKAQYNKFVDEIMGGEG